MLKSPLKSLGQYLCLFGVVLLCGCLEYNEDVTVHSNNQATLATDFGILAEFMDDDDLAEVREELKELEEELKRCPEIVEAKCGVEIRGEMVHMLIMARVSHYKYVGKVSSLTQSESGISFEDLGEGRMRYSRHFDSDDNSLNRVRRRVKSRVKAKYQQLKAQKAASVKKLDEQQFFMTFRFHAPTVFEANEPGAVSGGTVEWKFPIEFDGQNNDPSVLTAEFSLSSQTAWIWWVIGAIVAFLSLSWLKGQWANGGLRKVAKATGAM